MSPENRIKMVALEIAANAAGYGTHKGDELEREWNRLVRDCGDVETATPVLTDADRIEAEAMAARLLG